MTDTIYLTKKGLEELKIELKELIDGKRPEMAKRIKDARDMGDLSENAEYHSAKEEQAFVEGRIAELEDIIKNAQVQKISSKDVIAVGTKITVKIDGDEQIFHLVGAPEADPAEGKVSHESPLGSQLMGKKVGDKFEVEAPVGKLTYTILKIH
jgi:transcription elongation factor GreA